MIRKKFRLGSTDFTVSVLHLDAPPSRNLFGTHVRVAAGSRGLGRARLEQFDGSPLEDGACSSTVNRSGRFSVSLAARRSTDLRLAYNDVAGDPVALRVTPRVLLQADGPKLARLRRAAPPAAGAAVLTPAVEAGRTLDGHVRRRAPPG